jgi:hypothetical protein
MEEKCEGAVGPGKTRAYATDDIIYDHKWTNDDAIGVDHIDRRPNKSTAERGIVMK